MGGTGFLPDYDTNEYSMAERIKPTVPFKELLKWYLEDVRK